MQPIQPDYSEFELKRRGDRGDAHAPYQLRQLQLYAHVVSLIHLVTGLLLVVTTMLLIATFGWLYGIGLSILLVVLCSFLGRTTPANKIATRLYSRVEHTVLNIVEKYPVVSGFLRPRKTTYSSQRVDSREELQHIIAMSEHVLTQEEKKLIVNSLSFKDTLIDSIMVPRTMIKTISYSEFLGPLTLDELHKDGYSRLPVIRGDIDHVVGILHLQNLLALDTKRSVTAEKAMQTKVYYIRHDQTLHHALAAFLRTHQHLFIVVNEFRETVGLLTLEDVIEALLGRKIIDEFDAHDDIRTVALRNPSDNNTPASHTDV